MKRDELCHFCRAGITTPLLPSPQSLCKPPGRAFPGSRICGLATFPCGLGVANYMLWASGDKDEWNVLSPRIYVNHRVEKDGEIYIEPVRSCVPYEELAQVGLELVRTRFGTLLPAYEFREIEAHVRGGQGLRGCLA